MLQQAPPAIVQELHTVEEQLASTYKNHDCAGWGALLGEEWFVSHITGQVITKADALDMCKVAPEISSEYEQLAYRVYDDMAIVTGINHASANGQTISLRFTDVLVRRSGKWVVVASHATRLP